MLIMNIITLIVAILSGLCLRTYIKTVNGWTKSPDSGEFIMVLIFGWICTMGFVMSVGAILLQIGLFIFNRL